MHLSDCVLVVVESHRVGQGLMFGFHARRSATMCPREGTLLIFFCEKRMLDLLLIGFKDAGTTHFFGPKTNVVLCTDP